jgi:hypothetical protein
MRDVYKTPAAEYWLNNICRSAFEYVRRHIASGHSVSRYDAEGQDLWVTRTASGYLVSLRRDQVF